MRLIVGQTPVWSHIISHLFNHKGHREKAQKPQRVMINNEVDGVVKAAVIPAQAEP